MARPVAARSACAAGGDEGLDVRRLEMVEIGVGVVASVGQQSRFGRRQVRSIWSTRSGRGPRCWSGVQITGNHHPVVPSIAAWAL